MQTFRSIAGNYTPVGNLHKFTNVVYNIIMKAGRPKMVPGHVVQKRVLASDTPQLAYVSAYLKVPMYEVLGWAIRSMFKECQKLESAGITPVEASVMIQEAFKKLEVKK